MSGEGARFHPGRWHVPGTPLVYSASSKASAFAEVASHISGFYDGEESWIEAFHCIRIDVPREVSRQQVRLSDLPLDWWNHQKVTQQIGSDWLKEQRSCILRVPSLSVPGDAHYLINPAHRDFELLFAGPARRWRSFEDYDESFDEEEGSSTTGHRSDVQLAAFSKQYGPKDVFLCHAPADRQNVVIPLRDALFDLGISSWADFAEITVGDSIIGKVNQGLASAKFVIVVVSPEFLKEKNALRQLNSALARESATGQKIVLPIIVNRPNEKIDLMTTLPLVAEKAFYMWDGDSQSAALELKRAIGH